MLGVASSGPLGGGLTNAPAHVASTAIGDRQRRSTFEMDRERDAWAVLCSSDGIGPVGFATLLRHYGSGAGILAEAASRGGVDRMASIRYATDDAEEGRHIPVAVAKRLAQAAQRADATLARIAEVGLVVVTTFDQAYPGRLAAIEMPPPVLFVLGNPAAMDQASAVAIVGTRRPTETGRAIAARIATALVGVGTTVVSGLATGIDGAAHAASLHAKGTTVAVIGSGHARLFPRLHARLADSIATRGGAVVSELAPDVDATRGTFPRRNRVISGLADATVVVEAPARSGALITASWAMEQGRGCFLVPGSIDAHASAGCLAFLREYPGEARVVAGIPQLIADLGLASRVNTPTLSRDAASALVEVGATAARIGQELVHGRTTVDELVAVTGWPVATVLAALTVLERHGLVVGVHGRFRVTGLLAAAEPAALAKAQRPRR